MKRIRDSIEPEHELARQLLSAVEPLERSPERRSRVWRAVSLQSASSRRPRALTGLLLALGMSAAAAASATHGELWTWPSVLGVSARGGSLASVEEAPRRSTGARAPHAASSSAAAAEDEPTAEATPPDEPTAEQAVESEALARAASPGASSRRASGSARAKASAPVARRSTNASSSAKPGPLTASEESKLLLDALRARKQGDSERAEKLAADYQRRNPSGVLAEEALVLRLEAAIARKDPAARALGREYLARFPGGRFEAQARRALDTSGR